MTDLPKSAADRAAKASTPDIETPAGDPELAALVRRDPPPDDADETPQASEAGPTTGDATPEAGASGEPISEHGVDAVPVLPFAAAVNDGEPPAPPRRRRS